MVRGLGPAKRSHMATDTLRGEALAIELPDGPDGVAGIAIHGGVRPDEREAVLVLIDVVDGDLPAGIAVAYVALGAILAAVQISVTVLALPPDVGEKRVGVAIRASYVGVHAAQRETGLAMIKFGRLEKGGPGLCGVAVFAGKLQRPVRTPAGVRQIGVGRGGRSKRCLEQENCL